MGENLLGYLLINKSSLTDYMSENVETVTQRSKTGLKAIYFIGLVLQAYFFSITF